MKYWSKFFGLLAIGFGLLGGVISAQAGAVGEEQQAEFRPPVMVVNTSFLNVRTGPSTGYTVLITVTGGTQLPVLGIAPDRVWYQVSTAAGVGWINSEFAIGRGEFRNVPTVEAPVPVAVGVDMAAPGTPSQAAAFTGGRAWGASVTITHPARLQPAMSSPSPGQASENPSRIYTLMSSASSDGSVWYQVDIPELGAVWIEGSKAQLRPYACQMTAVVMLGTARPNMGPDGSGTLTGQVALPPGAEAYLLDAQGAFFKIELADGNTGWLRQEEVAVRSASVTSAYCATGGVDSGMTAAPSASADAPSADRPPGSTQPLVSSARVIVNTPFLNIRSGPGSQFPVITSVPGGTVLDVTGFAPDGVWYRVSGSFGMGWLDSNFAILRGDGSRLPVVNR